MSSLLFTASSAETTGRLIEQKRIAQTTTIDKVLDALSIDFRLLIATSPAIAIIDITIQKKSFDSSPVFTDLITLPGAEFVEAAVLLTPVVPTFLNIELVVDDDERISELLLVFEDSPLPTLAIPSSSLLEDSLSLTVEGFSSAALDGVSSSSFAGSSL